MEDHFEGRIGRYWWDAEPWWPNPVRPPEGAPNILIVVLDDVGFAQVGCFGSDIATPNLDALAAAGLRYTNFHTTALCSPTRACVLTGRNHHTCGMGRIIELAAGFPGYHARIPRSCGFLPEMLTPHGYAAWAVGKWHLTPEDETHLGATRERWPLGRGFERYYGFINGGETHQFAPELVYDNHFVDPPRSIEEGYHLTEDLVDKAVEFVSDLRQVDPAKPFLLWFATGACHSPHHAPPEWIERYAGAFDDGWDAWRERTFARQVAEGIVPAHTELSPRPDWVPAWADLPEGTRRLYARYMEAFAGYLSHTDHHLGRLLDFLAGTGELDNTMVMVLSDNGASSEGGPTGSINDVRLWNGLPRTVEEALDRIGEIGGPRAHNNYPWGWTVAGNTPFRRWKRETHEGGVADPLIVSWPARMAGAGGDRGDGLRRQYVHAIDLAPTILEAIGIEPPAEIRGVRQVPAEGTSFLRSLTDPAAPEHHVTQYYEMFGCQAIYHDGWKAVTYHPIQDDKPGLDRAEWELYDLRADPSECHDLASEQPERLAEMVELWWREAEAHDVLPLDNRPFSEFIFDRPDGLAARDRYVYRPGGGMVPEFVAVNVRNRWHRVTAEIDVPEGGVEGVILAQGSYLGGWAFYVVDSTLRYVHNLSGLEEHRVASPQPLAPGHHVVGFQFRPGDHGSGEVDLVVDGEVVGSGSIPRFTWTRFSLTGHGLTCGRGLAPAVSDEFVAPFRFTGGLSEVVVEVEPRGELTEAEAEAEAQAAITTQ
ncbi:MAG: arylsulfatase [Actinobacteria bacterium]|nr:arylsulfatase [Actinomycetota bacterium]